MVQSRYASVALPENPEASLIDPPEIHLLTIAPIAYFESA
jgi:hypothetical protein